MARIALIVALLTLAFAAPAGAEPLSGSSDDPADGTGTPSQDLEQVRSTFDGATGEWQLVLRVRGAVSTAEAAAVHGILYRSDPARPGVCPDDDVTAELGRLEASTDPARDDQTFRGTHAEKAISADGRELTFDVRAPALVGASALCATVSLSKGHPFDVLDHPVMLAPASAPPPPPNGGNGGTPPPAAPRIALASRTLRVSHGAATLKLKPFAARTTLGVSGAAARGKRTVAAGRAAAVKIVLTRAGRRLVARHRRVRVRLTVTALQSGRPRATKRFTVTLTRSA